MNGPADRRFGMPDSMIRLRRLVAREFRQLVDIDLRFPPRGRILVQGRNEAGKSTLFEAIFVALFGRPLDGKKLDECVQYGKEQAWLELELELSGGRTMTIARRIRAASARNRYELTIDGPDGASETVQGAPVGDRIEAELGLDGEALLNTCFVEQKKLEKLEGMGLREREQSLMKLLNLDRMVALAEELKVTRADQADVLKATALLLLELERYRAARRSIERVLAMAPEDPEAWLIAGSISEALDEGESALECYERALAKDGRLHILGEMAKALPQARTQLGEYAPRIEVINIPTDKIREVIGSGGKVIREIVEVSGAKVDINDDGVIKIASASADAIKKAHEMIWSIVAEPEEGKIYTGKVVKLVDFGAFVNFFGKRDGLVHVSQIANKRLNHPNELLKEGQEVKVKLLGFDERGKVRLGMKMVDQETGAEIVPEKKEKEEPAEG